MTTQYGFELVAERDIAEIQTHAQLFRHIKAGAELAFVQNDDENKVFGITFRTPGRFDRPAYHGTFRALRIRANIR